MACNTCKRASTCFDTIQKQKIKFGPVKTIKHGVKKVPRKKFVAYGENRTVTCGKFTEDTEKHNCCCN